MLYILTCNQLFFLDAFFLYIILFLLLLTHNLVPLETPSFLNIQFCQITFFVFLCAIATPYKSLSGAFRRFQALEAFTCAKANPEGVRAQTGANFESMANLQAFRRLSLHISCRPDTLSCFLVVDAAALANVKALARVECSAQQTSQPPNMRT
jgi:hypothetical protein